MEKGKGKGLLVFLAVIIILLLGAVIYLLVDKNGNNNTVGDRTLTATEFAALNLSLKKPSDLYGSDFKYCEDKGDYSECANNKTEYSISMVATDTKPTNFYQTLEVLFDSAKIENNKLVVKLYMYNYEQQQIAYCNSKDHSINSDADVALGMDKFAKRECSPYTYTFNVVKNGDTTSYEFVDVK